jgi:hypothetical protein
MIKTAGVVHDFYDDQGEFLKAKLAGAQVPESIAEAVVLSPEERAALPDNAFAAVIQNGDETLRKFACVDKGNTLVSALYFLENRNKLPPAATMKIAHNLVEACRFFEVVPPPQLLKEAAGKVLIKGDGAEILAPRKGEKRADLTGTREMPITPVAPKKIKTAAPVIHDPYVDTTTMEMSKEASEAIPDELYALVSHDGGRSFPLKTWGQVKEASVFFEEQGKRMHPRTRKEFCTKLAARANELGFEVTDHIQKYGSETYAPHHELGIAIETRRQLWRDHHDEAVSLLDGLMEKRAEMDPSIFAETLAQIDTLVSADRHWNKDIPDPWLSTFGVEKTAAWRWVHANDVLTEDQLTKFVTESNRFLCQHFGKDLGEAMRKNPVSTFDSLPLPQKRAIARLAAHHEDGGDAAVISQ